MRATVEDVIGCWKSKWRSLKNGLRFRGMEKCSKYIQVLACISNFVSENDHEERLSIQNFSINDLEPRILNDDDNEHAHVDYDDIEHSENEDSDHENSDDDTIPDLDQNIESERTETGAAKRKRRKRAKEVKDSDSANEEREPKERNRRKRVKAVPTNEKIFQKYYAGLPIND